MKDREIDAILQGAARNPGEVDPALLRRITESVGSSLRPVRPLPPASVLALGLFLVSAAVALTGALALGLHGLRVLNSVEIGVIFSALGALAWLAATRSAKEMAPGSWKRMSAAQLTAAISLSLVALFALLFQGYGLDRFVARGIPCLTTGLLHALVAGAAGWVVLRRGFAVNPVAAGLSVGTLASLAGVAMLELHCANLEALHVMVWHVGVIPLSGAAGALIAARRARRPS